MNYTSVEQSSKLLELGLNPESADMHYGEYEVNGEKYPVPNLEGEEYYIPCWSVGALLAIMPKINDGISNCVPNINKYYSRNNEISYTCSYVRETLTACAISNFNSDSIINSVFDTIVWLLENNYINH